MITTTPADCHSCLRTFVACLIISLLVLSPLTPLAPSAVAAPKPAKPAAALPSANASAATAAQPAAPLVPSITATKVDSFADADMDGKAAPGETITYDVNISNSGTDATGVNFTDTIDANTTLVGGSLKVSPLAYADTYSATQSLPLSAGAPGVLTNDTGIPSPTAVAIAGGATAQGGTVTLNTDGSFVYNPPVGFTGSDSFNYTITNGLTPNDTAQVTINVDAAPSVINTTPANGASNQSLSSDITITFSEPVNVTGNWFQVACTSSGTRNVADTVVTGGPTTFTINPTADFTQNETCTVTVFAAQVSDQDAIDPPDNMLADFVFSFTTQDAAPSVSTTNPTNGATEQITNTNIDITFNEAVNVTGNWFQIVCTSSGTRNVADTVVTGGPSAFTINPNADFAAGETCTVTVFAAQVTDQDSDDPPDNMAANFVFSFSTESAPTVNATTPTNGATQIANNTNITLTFSEPVNVTGNWFQVVGSTSGTRNVADTVVTGGPTTFTINPNVDFANGESVTVTVFAAQVTDQDPNDPPDNMATNFVFSFTIDQPPSVSATTPTNGATNQSASTDISITFSEPVNVTGNWFQIVCTTSGTKNVADTVVTGGPTAFTINPNADFTAGETCTVTVFAAQVTDQDSGDPPDNMAANFVFSFQTTDSAPTVTATTPTNGAVNQATNANIDVTFSEPVNVTGNWFQIVCTISGTRNVADTVVTGGPTTFTINPNTDFTPGETCTVTIVAAQVTDQDSNDPPDNMAANFVFSFSMDVAPSVTATTPTNGATQVAGNTDVTVTFSEPVDVTGNWIQLVGATSGTRNVADTVVTGGPTTFTINPNVDFAPGELVTVTVFAAQVSDQDSNDPPDNMTANFVFSFTIDQAPSVTATTPTNGATQVAINSNLTVTFSEPVNVTGNWFQIVCPTTGTRNVADTVVTGGPTTFTINPNADFTFNETCVVTVFAAQVSDQDSADPPDNMVANFAFSFTTVDAAPTVTATTPTNGATNQAANTNIDVTFSEPVNVTGNWFQIVCTTSGTRNVVDTVVTGGPTTFTINPNTDFTAAETCTVTIIATQVTDQDTNDPPDNMAANFVFSFSIDNAPSVTATTPTNLATQVANNTNISITFSEPVNVTGNWFQVVGSVSGTRNVADTVVTGGPTTFTINPNTDFTNGETVTVTVFSAQVSDQDGNDPPDNMLSNFVFSFTIDLPPAVTTTVPANSAINILKTANIVINFNENVNATTSSFTIECPAPGNLQAFTVSGSGTNQITLDPTSNLPQGQICTVTVIANQISDTDAGDPPDNMLANFVFSFGVQPEAFDDARNATGNIQIQTGAAGRSGFSVLTNDIGPGITVTASDSTSVRGGNVSVAVNGTFTYNPPAGYEGPDSFNYTISNNAGSDIGTVNITIAGMIWFIDDNAASGSCTTNNNICGRLTNPFSTLPSFEAVNGNPTPVNGADVIAPEAGDHIFIFSGTFTGPLTLEANQRVIGQGATTGTLSALSGITPATDSDPLPNTGGTKPSIGGGGFNVVSNNQLYGLQFDDSTSTSINSIANVGTMIVGDVTILNDGSASSGMILDDGGTITNTGTNTITTTTGTALSVTNTTIAAGGLTFRSISAGTGASGPVRGIILNNAGSGNFTITGDGASANSGGTIQHTAGTPGSTGLGGTGAVDITGGSGTYTFRFMRILAPGGNGFLIFNSPSTISIEKSTIDHNNANISPSYAVRHENHSGTATLTFDGLTVQNKLDGNTAVSVSMQDTASVTFNVLDTNTGDSFNTTFQNLFGSGIVVGAGDNTGANGTATVTVSNAKFLTPAANGINDLELTVQQNAVLNFNINNNTFDRATVGASALVGVVNVNATGSGRIGSPGNEAVIQNNIIQNLGTSNAVLGYQGIRVAPDNCSPTGATPCTVSPVTHRLRIQGNTLQNIWQTGVNISARGRANLNLQFLNNTVGTLANPVGKSNRRGVLMETQANSNIFLAITGNTIVGAGTSNSNAALALRAGTDNGEGDANGTIFTTMSGNTIKNSAAGGTGGWFRAETINLGAGVSAANICLDYNNNTLRNSADVADASKEFNLQHNSTGTFTRRNGGGNVGTETTSGVIGSNTGCTAPSFAFNLSPNETTGSQMVARASQAAAPAVNPVSPINTSVKRTNEQTVSHHAKVAKRDSVVSTSDVVRNTTARSTVTTPAVNKMARRQQVSANQDKTPRGVIKKPRVRVTAGGGETVSHSVGTLLAGKTVHIQFQVTVNSPYLGGATVSNQGTVSGTGFTDVLTDDPAIGGANDPTTTPILLNPNISISDAQANEPASGSAPMLFTVSLSAPAPAGGASVHYQTADEAPALNHAVAGVDYTAVPDTVLNFAAGEQFKTITVNILADPNLAEADETFLVQLSNPTNAVIVDNEAVGTIKQGNAAGTFLISEIRTSGPAGEGDDFVELYNNSDTPLVIAASDQSGGYGLFKMGADCGATPVLIGVIPNGTTIPARGHYLLVGSAYSLANYGGTGAAAGNQMLSSDIESDRNVGIFNTASVANVSSVTRLDAVGFGSNTGGVCDLLREGATLPPLAGSVLEHSYVRDECGKKANPATFGPCPTAGLVKDSNVNNDDFIFVDTLATVTVAGQRLGAPGPQNLASPLVRTNTIATLFLDSNFGGPAAPNRLRDLTPQLPNAQNGTLSIRRRFVNNTGAPVTRLRFRLVDISTISVPGGIADIRALTSTDVVVTGITDSATCLASTGSATTPCTVTVRGTTLETPPAQPLGGGHNATMSAGTITLGSPLAPGASINLQFLLGVQQTGSFKFFFNIEALP